MTHKEFLAWLEGYVAGLPANVSSQNLIVILQKARSVKAEPNIVENITDKVKQMLHD